MELDFKGVKIPILTIPKGTLLFRAVRHSEGDFSGADISPGKRCIPKNYNVFFYMNPYVPEIHPELAKVPNVDVYETPHDLKVVSMVRPSPYSRGSHYKTEKFPMISCDQVKDTCLRGREYDPCFKDEFLETFPDVHGWVAVGRSDSKKLLDAMKDGKVPKDIHLVKDQRGVEGAMELALYPLRKREMDNVYIEHPTDWKARHEFNYKHVATLKRNCDDRKDFLATRTSYDADSGFYTLREGQPVAQPVAEEVKDDSLVLRKQKDAMKVAAKCLEEMNPAQSSPMNYGGISEMPPQVMGPWGMDMEAVEHTLEYVYGKLHHACYLLCVTGGKPILYKLEERTTAPGFEEALFKKKLKRSMRNRPTRDRQWRVIQCLVKPYAGETTFTDAYARFFNEMSYALPDGVFLMNLTDAVILKKDGTEPWPMVNGSGSIGKYAFPTHIPILGGSGQEGYWDIPIPNYDDVQIILGMDNNLVKPELTNWGRKQNRAVFRGAPTGCGYTAETNMRLKLAKMNSSDLDVGVTVVKSNSIKFDPKNGMGQLDMTKELKAVGRLSLDEQSGYKYIIHIDGNVAAYRLLKMMTTGSLILKVKGPYILWVDHMLKDKQHYVEVAADLSDLQTVLQWCRDHDLECQQIARRGMEFAQKALTKEYVDASFAKIMWSLSGGPPNTPPFSPNPTEPEVPPMTLEEESTTPKFGPGPNESDVPPMKLEEEPVAQANMYLPLSAGAVKKLPQGNPTILVPFREQVEQQRGKQLAKFMKAMKTNHPDWDVLVIEQSDDGKKFNRGALLNVGTKLAEAKGSKYVVFHDVDLIPLAPLLPYYSAIPQKPIHIAKAWTTKYDSPTFLGGVLSMSMDDVKKVNGFPNNFWGWGGEDDALRNRIQAKGLQVWQPTIRGKGAFKESVHVDTRTKQEWKNMEKWENVKADKMTAGTNGLNNVEYSVTKEENYTERMKKVTVTLK
jgi:Glycosyl transferase family 90/N-terminal domain of galactosyltransferase/N-terminal region of glycosyl transferase group 7